MGLNLVIGCHRCKEKVWTFRGEGTPLYSFYRDHWRHSGSVELSDDQSERAWVCDPTYINMGLWHGVYDTYIASSLVQRHNQHQTGPGASLLEDRGTGARGGEST